MEALIGGLGEVDPDAPIEGEVALQPVLECHGWTLHAHPLFLDQVERLLAVVERAKRSDPGTWQSKPADPEQPSLLHENIRGSGYYH